MEYKLLEKINSPSDLKALDQKDIPLLAEEIRSFLLERTSENGGHLASNLGVVELTLALHRVFDSPSDHIIFDVGHQSYVHKLITGRRESFSLLRKTGGMSGFTSRRESEHDQFGAGHSSTSISAALGFAEADKLLGKKSHTVCVIGDGAYTGGMAHEALNNCKSDLPLIIVLNENGMSISSNKGLFASYLSRVRISKKYRGWKKGTNDLLEHTPLIGKPIKRFMAFMKARIAGIWPKNYFEELGLYYIGAIDGNNYEKVERALRIAKSTGKTVVVHVKTKKGRGYTPAELSPEGYHSVGSVGNETYHSVFSETLSALADKNDTVTAVTAAMGIGTGLDSFGEKYPKRYFDVGIAEGHALTFSAGLAANGMHPFVAIYSTFLQRGYDSILHDIALQSLPVSIMIDRAGLSLGDGATHHGIFDVSFLSHIPTVEIFSPVSYRSLSEFMEYSLSADHPVAIRYPNSSENKELYARFKKINEDDLFGLMVDFDVRKMPEYIFITYGKIYERVCEAKELLFAEGIDAGIILLEALKPYSAVADELVPIISSSKRTVFVEEGIRYGGAGEIIGSLLSERGLCAGYSISAIDDNFASPSEPTELYDFVGLSPRKLCEAMKKDAE